MMKIRLAIKPVGLVKAVEMGKTPDCSLPALRGLLKTQSITARFLFVLAGLLLQLHASNAQINSGSHGSAEAAFRPVRGFHTVKTPVDPLPRGKGMLLRRPSLLHAVTEPSLGSSRQLDALSDIDTSRRHLRGHKPDAGAAIAAALSRGSVVLPCGRYDLWKALPIIAGNGMVLRGRSAGCVVLNLLFASGDAITVRGTYDVIENLTIEASVQRTSGAAIRFVGSYGGTARDIVLTGRHYDGVIVENANTTHLDGFDMRPPYMLGAPAPDPQKGAGFAGNAAILITGKTHPAVDTFISRGNTSQWHYGLKIDYASGVYGGDIDNVGNGNGVNFDPAANQSVTGVILHGVLSDTSYGDCWLFTGKGAIADVQLDTSWASSSVTANGFAFINPAVDAVTIGGGEAINNFAAGINIAAGQRIDVVHPKVLMNNAGQNGNSADVLINSSAVDYVQISGGFFGQGGTIFSSGGRQRTTYAVDAGTGESHIHLSVVGIQGYNHSMGLTHLPSGASVLSNGNTGS